MNVLGTITTFLNILFDELKANLNFKIQQDLLLRYRVFWAIEQEIIAIVLVFFCKFEDLNLQFFLKWVPNYFLFQIIQWEVHPLHFATSFSNFFYFFCWGIIEIFLNTSPIYFIKLNFGHYALILDFHYCMLSDLLAFYEVGSLHRKIPK